MTEHQLQVRVLWGFALFKFLLHTVVASPYGYFADELYFLDASRNLSAGYADFPPLIAVISFFVRHLLGDSLWVLRAVAAAAGTGVVVFAGLLARELGGKAFAIALTMLAVTLTPGLLSIHALFTMNVFDHLFWILVLFLSVRALHHSKYWLAVGVAFGLGILNKLSILVLAPAIFAALILTKHRVVFRTWYPYWGAGITALIVSPFIYWQIANGFPTARFLGVYTQGNAFQAGLASVLFMHFLVSSPSNLPLYVGSLFTFSRQQRFLALIALIVPVICLGLRAKFYFLVPIYPIFLAAGAVFLEQICAGKLKKILAFTVILVSLPLLPVSLPVLTPERTAWFFATLPMANSVQHNQEKAGPLPQHFADQLGWPEMVERVAQVYREVPKDVVIVGGHYGETGALNFFGPALSLPRAYGVHMDYALHPPNLSRGALMVGVEYEKLVQIYKHVVKVGEARCPLCMQRGNPVVFYLCSELRVSSGAAWESLIRFY